MRYEIGLAVFLALGIGTLATLISVAESNQPGRLWDLPADEREALAQIRSLGVIVRDDGFR